jgi:hypothetical protein
MPTTVCSPINKPKGPQASKPGELVAGAKHAAVYQGAPLVPSKMSMGRGRYAPGALIDGQISVALDTRK